MNIFISGSAGFVATNLIKRLGSHHIIAVDYLKSFRSDSPSPNIRYINFDLSTKPLNISGDIDLIIHLATINQIALGDNPALLPLNISMTVNMLNLARKKKCPIIFTSSCSVYGEGWNHHEDDHLDPQSLYAIGKMAEEKIVRFYHDKYGVDATILRFSNCYGDTTYIENKMYPGKKDVIRIFMEKAIRGEPLPLIRGMGRDYTYIDDVIDAILKMIPPKGFNVYNVGTGVETLTDDLPTMIENALGKSVIIEEIPLRETDDIHHRTLNIERISKYWSPLYNMEEGVKEYAKRIRNTN